MEAEPENPSPGFGAYAEVYMAYSSGYSIQIKDKAGQNMGILDNSSTLLGFKAAGGYRFAENRSVFAGLGVGIDYYLGSNSTPISKKASTFIPITIELKACNRQGRRSPLMAFSAGYAIGLSGLNGGLIFHPQLGYKTSLSGNKALHFSAGYKIQVRDDELYDGFNDIQYRRNNFYFGFITLNTGFLF